MPTYSYRCAQCGPFAAVRRMADFDQSAPCPVCASDAVRTLTVPALLGTRRGSQRDGTKRDGDDDAAGYRRLTHPAGCACC